ncbi:MAG: extracellular solute-binding protein [Saccharofermentans sp.]|nr:extracellular solute-binding protein [Saccharofermentans sp.]
MSSFRIKSSCFLLASLMCFSFIGSGCRHKGNEFPVIEYPENIKTEPSSEETSASEDDHAGVSNITVASPYSQNTIQYLSKLYYCKRHDLMDENNGSTIELEYLDGLDPDFIVDSILTSGEGASVDNIISWNEEGNAPDIFLTGRVDEMRRQGLIEPLNDYIAENTLYSSGRIYVNALRQVTNNGSVYGVPFYSSVVLIAGNADFIPSTGKLSFKNSTEQFYEYLQTIASESSCIPFSSGYDAVPYINSAFSDAPCSFMMRDEYKRDKATALEVIGVTLEYVNRLYREGLSSNVTSDGTNPVFGRQAACWVASSSDISGWITYYPNKLYLLDLPSSADSSEATPMASLYSFCINSESSSKEFAADFASFMALDPDARMLIERLEHQSGFLPSIKNAEVWSFITSDEVFGAAALNYSQSLENAVYCPPLNDSLYISVTEYFASYDGGVFNPEACYGQP